MVLLAASVLGTAFFYQNVSHADTAQSVKTVQNKKLLSSKTDMTSFPWGNTGLTVTLDAVGTLHLPSGTITDPPALYTVLGDIGSRAVKTIEFDGPLVIYGKASLLFGMLPNVSELSGLSNLNTTNVINMDGMFKGCHGFTSLDLSGLDTQNVTSMYGMFYEMSGLKSLNLGHFNTAQVYDMSNMFYGCSLLTSLDLSSFETTNVIDMGGMFESCYSLASLNLSSFDTHKVTYMGGMFSYCLSLPSVNLNSFNTENVTDSSWMFENCRSLTSLDLSHFNTRSLENMSGMFAGCNSLLTLNLSSFVLPETTNVTGILSETPALSVLGLAPNSRIRTAVALYQDTAGNTIASNRVFGGQENVDTFSFLPKIIPGYTFQKANGKTSGTLTVAPQTVTFIYTKNT